MTQFSALAEPLKKLIEHARGLEKKVVYTAERAGDVHALYSTAEQALLGIDSQFAEIESDYKKLSALCTRQGIELMHSAELERQVTVLREVLGSCKNVLENSVNKGTLIDMQGVISQIDDALQNTANED